MWLDELLEISESRNSVSFIVGDLLQFGAMPLDYIVTHFVLFLGQQDFWLRVAPAFWSILTVPLMYRLAGRLLGRGAGLLAALLLAVSAFHVHYAQETRPYALLGLLSVASFYFLFRALKTNQWRYWGTYAVTTTLCLFTHYFTLFMIAAQGLIAGLWLLRPAFAISSWSRAFRFSGSVGVVVLALAFTPTFYNVLDVGRYFAMGLAQPASLTESAELKPNKDEGPVLDGTLFNDQLLQVLSGGGNVWRWVFLGLVALGVGVALWRWPRLALMLLAWATVPTALILLFLIHRGTFFATRYVTPAYFALLLLMVVGLLVIGRTIARRWPRARWLGWAVVVAIPFAFNLERVNAYYQVPKEDWRDAGSFLNLNYRPGDTVDAPLGGGVVFHYAPAATPGRIDTTALDDLAKVNGRLYVVMHPYIGPAEGGLRDWLSAQASTVEYPIDDTISVFVVDANHARADVLASITPPHSALALSALADQYAILGDTAAAETDYQQSLALDPAPRYQAAYADFLRATGRPEDAAKRYMAALAVDPQLVAALCGLGRIYYDRGLFDTAAPVLERAIALDPHNYAAAYFLWQTYDKLGRPADADRARDLAAQLVPDLIEPP
jgi:hypothetical protein